MGPPLTAWPHSHPKVTSDYTKCLSHLVDNVRTLGLNFTFNFILLHVIFNLSTVTAGPVVLSLDYLQGPVPVARNIRHLPCISRSTGHEGLCMFAIDCLKINGTHLGTCIDRFYFGSCCQIPDKNTLPQIIGNNIEDNSIDSANFVHPMTEDKVHSTVNKIPNIFPNKHDSDLDKPPTINVDKKPDNKLSSSTNKPPQDHTESDKLETKSDELTTLESKKDDDAKTTVIVTSSKDTLTTQFPKTTSQPIETTEIPLRLSTFQSVSGENSVTERIDDIKPTKTETTEASKPTSEQVSTEKPTKPPIKPVRPTYKPRPTNRPLHISLKPKPTRPVTPFTRKPPYKPSSKRPPTKKPLTYPPRLNITIIPQSTSTRPVFTRPSVSTITYINTTLTKVEEKPTSTTSTTTTSTTTTTTTTTTTLPPPTTTTTTTTTTAPPATVTTTQTPKPTERIITTQSVTETSPITEEITDKQTDRTTIVESQETVTIDVTKDVVTEKDITQEPEKITEKIETTEKDTIKPATEQDVTPEPYTEYQQFVTWSDYGSSSSKAPDTTTTVHIDDGWSPITPPDGWVLLSTIPPKTSTTSASTTTTTTTTAAPTTEATTIEPTTTSVRNEAEAETTTKSEVPTTQASMATSATSITSSPVYEFTVNITQYPSAATSSSTPISTSTSSSSDTEGIREPVITISSTTSSIGLTTFASVSVENASLPVNVTETSTEGAIEQSTQTSEVTTEAAISSTTPETYNMSNYKEVCGRRIWPQARIVGGTKSEFGQWPWQISLRQYRTSSYLHKCGAALLNENWAITAAHCVERVPPSDLLVRLGEYDLASDTEPYGFAERRVQIVASHPHFDPATFEYDLALLRFYEPVTFQPNILPVCVPDDDDDYVGKTAHVTGWGRLYDDGPLPSILQEVEVPVINNTACESMYLEAGYNEHIPHIFICAGWTKGGSDSCEGDSGGPMVVQRSRDNRFVLSGIISWGIGCAEPNQPGVYTRISEFRDWINQILQF